MKLKQIATQYHDFIINFSGCLTVNVIFLSGIGRYRIVLLYALYSLLKALSSLIKVEQRIYLFFFPAIVISFFLDVTKGPIFPIFAKNYLLVALPVMVVVDGLVRNSIEKLVSKITEGQLFVVCPACNYDNKDLVEKCINCSYKKDDHLAISVPMISPSQKGDKISPRVLNLLSIGKGEEILLHKKLTRFIQKFKNGERQARKHFVITTAKLILIDYYSFHIHVPPSWRERDIIPLSEVKVVEGKMKKFYMDMRPFLIIKTSHDDVYEMAFSSFGKYKEEITKIANVIKRANPEVEIKIDLSEKSWRHSL